MRKIEGLILAAFTAGLLGCGNKVSPPHQITSIIFPPSGLSATILTTSTLELAWTDNSDNEDGFYVMRRDVAGDSIPSGGGEDTTGTSEWAVIDSLDSNTTAYYDSTVMVGEKYIYRISAYNSIAEPVYSNIITISFSIPDAPSGLTAEVLSDSRIALSWNDNSDNETNFLVCRQDTGIVVIRGILISNETSFTDSNLSGNTPYSYYIIASNSLGNSISETVTATTLVTIRLIGSIPGPFTSFPTFLMVEGNYAYCSGFWGAYNRLRIMDISVPDQPSITGEYFILFQMNDFYVNGNYAYLAHDSGFVVLDVSEPSNPVFAGEYIKSPGRHFINVTDDYIFLACNNDLPDSLQIMTTSDSSGFELVGNYEEPYDIRDMFSENDYVYLLAGGALKIIDVSNPSNPVIAGYYNPEYSANSIHVCNGYAFMPGDFGFAIINVANPLSPIAAGTYLSTEGCDRLFADSSYVYIYNFSDLLRIIDISVPALPDLLGRYDNSSIGALFVEEDYIYICNNDSIQILRLEIDDDN